MSFWEFQIIETPFFLLNKLTMLNELRELLINDILVESGEMSIDARHEETHDISTTFLSQKYFKWTKNGDNGGLPYFSQPCYYPNSDTLKSTRYTIPKGKIDSKVYVAVASNNSVYFGMKMRGNAERGQGLREQDSITCYLEEIYDDYSSDFEILEDIPSKLINKFTNRKISLKDYEEALIDYLLIEKYPLMFDRYYNEILKSYDEDEEDFVLKEAMTIDDFRAKMQARRKEMLKQKHEQNQAQREEDAKSFKDTFEKEKRNVADPFQKLLYQIEDGERKRIKDENELKRVMKAHEYALKRFDKLMNALSFEKAKGQYTSNGLLNLLNAKYASRTIFWSGSFWNVK
jgi:hypothetical protein